MGLDMYLRGEKFHWTDWEDPKKNKKEDGFQVSTTILSLGYWRKHPNLHGYIVETFGGGVDECQKIELDQAAIMQILNAIKTKRLPVTEGFFFGASDGSEGPEDTAIFEKALRWLRSSEPEGKQKTSRSVIYQASW